MWKFCGKAQFPHSFGQFARNYAETLFFHKMNLGEITVFYAVLISVGQTHRGSDMTFWLNSNSWDISKDKLFTGIRFLKCLTKVQIFNLDESMHKYSLFQFRNKENNLSSLFNASVVFICLIVLLFSLSDLSSLERIVETYWNHREWLLTLLCC